MADTDPLTTELDAITAREQAATPGPWGWFGNTDTHEVYLATRRWGRFTVMGFRRWGKQGTRPLFATGRTWKQSPRSDLDFGPDGRMTPADLLFTGEGEMTDADTLPVYAAAPDATTRRDPRVYRADLAGIRNPDAEFIAGAREDVPRLLAAVNAALKLADDARTQLSLHPDDCTNACADGPCTCSGDSRAVAWDLDPAKLRAAILAGLTGEGKSNG